jgi:hypothetical protein
MSRTSEDSVHRLHDRARPQLGVGGVRFGVRVNHGSVLSIDQIQNVRMGHTLFIFLITLGVIINVYIYIYIYVYYIYITSLLFSILTPCEGG